MSRQDIIDKLLGTYGRFGITKEILEPCIDDGINNYDLSMEAIYNGLRMSLGNAFNVNEYFTVEDLMIITEETREEVVQRIEDMRSEISAGGSNPDDYIKEIQVERFILPPGYLN